MSTLAVEQHPQAHTVQILITELRGKRFSTVSLRDESGMEIPAVLWPGSGMSLVIGFHTDLMAWFIE